MRDDFEETLRRMSPEQLEIYLRERPAAILRALQGSSVLAAYLDELARDAELGQPPSSMDVESALGMLQVSQEALAANGLLSTETGQVIDGSIGVLEAYGSRGAWPERAGSLLRAASAHLRRGAGRP